MLSTSLTLGCGGSGGVFAPSLFIGAMAGGAFGYGVNMILPSATASYGAYALVGMGAFFAVVCRGPITAIIILFELTLARSFTPESIYTERLLKKGINILAINQSNPMKEITVSRIMTRNFPTVTDTMPVQELSDKLKKSGHHGFPVVDQNGELTGVVTVTDLVSAMQRGSAENLKVADIATRNPKVCYPGQTCMTCGQDRNSLSADTGVDEGQSQKKLLGVLRLPRILLTPTPAQ
jgi:CIC family chloride channel protein